MSNVLVFGHLNPDNDAIMSAVVLAQLLNQVNYNGDTYEARRLGPLPAETAKLLADLGIDEPALLEEIPAATSRSPWSSPTITRSARPLPASRTLRLWAWSTTIALAISPPPRRSPSWPCPGARAAPSSPSSSTCWAKSPQMPRRSACSRPMMTDTLMLKSPTTTDVDRAVAAALGEQLGVDPVKFGMEVFLSRPSGSFTAEQMVGNDIKLFEVAGKKLLIGSTRRSTSPARSVWSTRFAPPCAPIRPRRAPTASCSA